MDVSQLFILDIALREIALRDIETDKGSSLEGLIWRFSNILKMLLLNLAALLFVRADIRKYQLESRYIGLLTFLFRPLGICLFLISLILQTRDEKVEASPSDQPLSQP